MTKKLPGDFPLLADMYRDAYYPRILVDKVRDRIMDVVALLESGERSIDRIQDKLDVMTRAIDDLAEEFYEHDSEIETVARDSIGETVESVLVYFGIDIDAETAIRERDW